MPQVPTTRSLRRIKSRAFAIEAALLKASVGGLMADREACRHCRRTPLVGERVYEFGQDIVCELCRPRRTGEPAATHIVRSPERSSVTSARPRE